MTKPRTITDATATADENSAADIFSRVTPLATPTSQPRPRRAFTLATAGVLTLASITGTLGTYTATAATPSTALNATHTTTQHPALSWRRRPKPITTPTTPAPAPTTPPKPTAPVPTATPTPPTAAPTAPAVKPTAPAPTKPVVKPTAPAPTIAPTPPVAAPTSPAIKPTAPAPTTPAAPTSADSAPTTIPQAGTPTGITLTPRGQTTITTPNTIIDAADITGVVVIDAANVTIRRSRISGTGDTGIYIRGGSLTLEDTTITGFDNSVAGSNYTATRVEITHALDDGFKIGSNVTIQDSWCHDMTPEPGAHADCGQIQSGEKNITIRHNWFDIGTGDGNSALFMAPDLGPSSPGPLTVENNTLGGGNFTLQCVDGANGTYYISGITIRNNQFLNNARYGPMRINVPATITGNTSMVTGDPIS
jgi:Right handed beta helix region